MSSEAVFTSEFKPHKLIFYPSGRLGNAIFRYMACAIVNLFNPTLEYTLSADFQPHENKFTYYPGVDYECHDIAQTNNTDNSAMECRALSDNAIMGYNTLGFFKHTIDVTNLASNIFIYKENGHGLYVKKKLTLDDANFFNMYNKKLENFDIGLDGFFQFGHIYLKYKEEILDYIEKNKDKHYIETDLKERYLLRDIIDDCILPSDKHYDIAIHIRLGDFKCRPDFIELEYYLNLFTRIREIFKGQKICLIYQQTDCHEDKKYIECCIEWFQARAIPLCIESNDLMVDFNIMKQVKILICSMSTMAWTAAYLSKHIQTCYMPNYNFYQTERSACFFHKPIVNTILYNVKTLPTSNIKTYLLTLPEFAGRLTKLDKLMYDLAVLDLEPSIFQGVHGKDIQVCELPAYDGIKQLTWRKTSYLYDPRVRLNGLPMMRGELGCAWSHLNLLQQLIADPLADYYLVLEDDVELVKPLSELYRLLNNLPSDMDMSMLSKSDWYTFSPTQPVNNYFYECEKRYFNKTTAYIISKKGAKKVLAYTEHYINVPIDDLFNMIFRLTPDFRFYVPAEHYFKEQDNVISSIVSINQS
jgi:GR25 family glycosyltransferase involved in LPS biosynthesis